MASARDDGGVDIDLSTAHMGDPGKLSPEATAYVVWVRPLGGDGVGAAENVGAFKPNPELKGHLTFKTKHPEVEVFVTIEPSGDATQPTGRVVLRGEVTAVKGASASPAAAVAAPSPTAAEAAGGAPPEAAGGAAPAAPAPEPAPSSPAPPAQ